MNDIEKAIKAQQKLITNWEQRIQKLEEVIKKYPWGRDGLEYDFGDWRESELLKRKEQIEIALITLSALERQIPKKPFEYSYDESDGEDWYDEGYTYSCPICLNDGSEVGRYSKESEQWIFEMKEYCDNCGQRLEMK